MINATALRPAAAVMQYRIGSPMRSPKRRPAGNSVGTELIETRAA